jgi:Regulator of ribonuclease activity B
MWRRKRNGVWDPSDVLARQLAMNEQTWAGLQEHGLTEESEVRLDFFYNAPTPSAADELAAFLQEQTDYEVSANADSVYSVVGSTQPTTLDLDKLNEWVKWMVAAGAEVGECEFDGCGTKVP